jgi:hypothetical protein
MKPVLQALVLAERVYQDVSGKKIIAGTFNQINIGPTSIPQPEQLPDGTQRHFLPAGTDPGCPVAYVSLTDVVDGTEITLQMVNVSKNLVLFQVGVRIASNDRLATVEIVAPLPPMSMFVRELGVLSLDIVWQGEILGSHRLVVRELNPPTT